MCRAKGPQIQYVDVRNQGRSETQLQIASVPKIAKSLGFTRSLEAVSCPWQSVFFAGQGFRGDPFNPTYIAVSLCVLKVNCVCISPILGSLVA